MNATHFSKSYAEARRRFNEAAAAIGALIRSYPVASDIDEALAIDVACIGEEHAPTIVVSSAVHGVEGFFGSAIQLALLKQLSSIRPQSNIRYVLIHSVNPFGFSQLRRFNEDNVDLNRNFHADDSFYQGAPPGYASLNAFLNPASPPQRFEPFALKALWNIWRNGLQSLKQTVAGGQYEYPRGIFFGGHGPCSSTQIIYDNCDAWIGAAERVVHIDFHSGLGAFGSYKLLLPALASTEDFAWYAHAFGSQCVERLDAEVGTAYQVSGLFDQWMQQHFASREYRVVGAEFGTYNVLRVLAAIRAENRAHHYANVNSSAYKAAKAELVECFCPSSARWRTQAIDSGLKIIRQATLALEP